MTNGIEIGDTVQIGGTFITGKVEEIDDHPFEYAMLKLTIEGAGGTFHKWESSRLARKIG